jgi:acetyl-CoA synthetase (ADP-forming)
VPTTLSEAASKDLLAGFGIPFPPEESVGDVAAALAAAHRLGYPVAAKLCGEGIAHKTERSLVALSLSDDAALSAAVVDLLRAATPDDGEVDVLVAPMIRGTRELMCGLTRDATFGPTVMVGMGGVMAEALADVAVRLVPLSRADAADMIDQLSHQPLLEGFRGEPAVDRAALVDVIMALADVALARPDIMSVDVNPLIICDGRPVAVDALVELAP